MIDNNITKATGHDNSVKREKIEAIYPHIVVSGNIENLYYSIQWYDIKKKSMQDGYGSYTLKNVRKWLKEDFEVVDDDIDNLINRMNAEIERLQELLEGWKTEAYKVANEKDELYCEAVERVKTIKAEAIKEFAERLCEGRIANDPVVIAVKVELKMAGEGG